MSETSFDSIERSLKEMLENTSKGDIQLPDFQRRWVWDDQHIKSLIASISHSYPIGAVMTLEAGGDGANFKPRPIEGTCQSVEQVTPETLILDGQQRFTALFQSLQGTEAVKTKNSAGRDVRLWYYLDMKGCVGDVIDREQAVLSVPEDKVARNFRGEPLRDLSSPEKEYENDMFPVNKLFDPAPWRRGYNRYWDRMPEKEDLFDDFEATVVDSFKSYHVPLIRLGKRTPKEAVCMVFEKVNTGGVPLTVFELLTASFAMDNFQLYDDWVARRKRLRDWHPILRGVQSDQFLQALTLLTTNARSGAAISCRRRDILRLTVEDYKNWAKKVEDGFKKAARFLRKEKIFAARDLPYQSQLTAMAAIMADLETGADTVGAQNMIARWYWCGVFGEIYGGPTETQLTRDFSEVSKWVRGGQEEPSTIRDAIFQSNRLLTLRTRNSAAYKGIHALLMRDGSSDFRTGDPIEEQTFFDDNIDIHHVFPRVWCERRRIDPGVFNSIINKTALSARTNRMIGGRAPSVYLGTLERNANIDTDTMDGIVSTHGILAKRLRADDFQGFFEARGNALLGRIEMAMGKPASRDEGVFDIGASAEHRSGGEATGTIGGEGLTASNGINDPIGAT